LSWDWACIKYNAKISERIKFFFIVFTCLFLTIYLLGVLDGEFSISSGL
jgi:hypothetical protein